MINIVVIITFLLIISIAAIVIACLAYKRENYDPVPISMKQNIAPAVPTIPTDTCIASDPGNFTGVDVHENESCGINWENPSGSYWCDCSKSTDCKCRGTCGNASVNTDGSPPIKNTQCPLGPCRRILEGSVSNVWDQYSWVCTQTGGYGVGDDIACTNCLASGKSWCLNDNTCGSACAVKAGTKEVASNCVGPSCKYDSCDQVPQFWNCGDDYSGSLWEGCSNCQDDGGLPFPAGGQAKVACCAAATAQGDKARCTRSKAVRPFNGCAGTWSKTVPKKPGCYGCMGTGPPVAGKLWGTPCSELGMASEYLCPCPWPGGQGPSINATGMTLTGVPERINNTFKNQVYPALIGMFAGKVIQFTTAATCMDPGTSKGVKTPPESPCNPYVLNVCIQPHTLVFDKTPGGATPPLMLSNIQTTVTPGYKYPGPVYAVVTCTWTASGVRILADVDGPPGTTNGDGVPQCPSSKHAPGPEKQYTGGGPLTNSAPPWWPTVGTNKPRKWNSSACAYCDCHGIANEYKCNCGAKWGPFQGVCTPSTLGWIGGTYPKNATACPAHNYCGVFGIAGMQGVLTLSLEFTKSTACPCTSKNCGMGAKVTDIKITVEKMNFSEAGCLTNWCELAESIPGMSEIMEKMALDQFNKAGQLATFKNDIMTGFSKAVPSMIQTIETNIFFPSGKAGQCVSIDFDLPPGSPVPPPPHDDTAMVRER